MISNFEVTYKRYNITGLFWLVIDCPKITQNLQDCENSSNSSISSNEERTEATLSLRIKDKAPMLVLSMF